MKFKKNIFWALLSGSLLAAAFPPMPFYLLAFVGFVPLLYIFTNSKSLPEYKYILVYIAFMVYHGGTNWWIGSWQEETDPYLMASGIGLIFIHPFFFLIPFWAFFRVREKIGRETALWSFPFLWVAFEWLHSLGEASYPWLTVGNTQVYNKFWVQFIDITGVWGASFLIALFNVIFIRLLYHIRDLRKSSSPVFNNVITLRYIAALALLIITPLAYGVLRVSEFKHEKLLAGGNNLTIAVVQPNINPWKKWSGGVDDQIMEHIQIQDSLIANYGRIDLAIWSETAIPWRDLALNSNHNYPKIKDWVDSNGASLMTGFSEVIIFENPDSATATARPFGDNENMLYESYNAAVMLNPGRVNNPQIYRKMKLTPFAERLPYAQYLLFARSWFEWSVGISAWGIGPEQKNLEVDKNDRKIKIAPIICIESIYPNFVRKFSREGAEIYSVITNDAWYDGTIGPEQHFQLAAVRAIENKRYIARCGNSGVSGFILPTGKSLLKAPQYERVSVAATIPAISEITFYARFGDWLAAACFSVAIIVLSLPFLKNRAKRLNFFRN